MNYYEQFRLYVDESGDHTSNDETKLDKRYLGVVGAAFRFSDHAVFRDSLDCFKEVHCGDRDAILHREDFIGKRDGFEALRDEGKSREFHTHLSIEMGNAKFVAFAVVVDKLTHGLRTYRRLKHPYHYCLHALVERYVGFLEQSGAVGDVMAESRGGVEDSALKEEYARIYSEGTAFCKRIKVRERLTSNEIKIKKKGSNIAGLQLADMVAFAATRDVLHSYKKGFDVENLRHYDRNVVRILENKYYSKGVSEKWPRVNGYGRVIL